MQYTKADLDAARARGIVDGLKMALTIAKDEAQAAKKEESYGLSSSVRERTQVRRRYAEIIASKIRKEIAKLK